MKHSSKVALCGMICALCTLCMFMTGLFPFATYALPAIAGVLLCVIILELNARWALVVYLAVSFLSFLLSPDREAALFFFAFFGHYPTIKYVIECKVKGLPQYLLKFGVFNLCIVGTFAVLFYLLRIPNLLDEFGDLGKYGVILLLLMGNVTFGIYDFALTRLITSYLQWFRPKFLKHRSS